MNNHLLCYWPTTHTSISKICPNFQVLSSPFSEVNELLDDHWGKIVLSENISTPIYVECVDQRFAVKNSGMSCLALKLNLSNPRKTILHATKAVAYGSRLLDTYMHICICITVFFGRLIQTHCSPWQWLRQFLVSQATWVWFSKGAEPPCCPLAILRATWPVSALTLALLYCCALYIAALSMFFFFLDFVSAISRWKSCKS